MNLHATKNNLHAFRHWFGASRALTMVKGTSLHECMVSPRVMYHTSREGGFSRFEIGRPTINSTTFSDVQTRRHALFVTPSVDDSNAYGKQDGAFVTGATTIPVYVRSERPLDLTEGVSEEDERWLVAAGFSERFIHNYLHRWDVLDDDEGKLVVNMLRMAGYDAVIFNDENPITGRSFEAWALFSPDQVVMAIDYPQARTLVIPPAKTHRARQFESALSM